MGRITLGSSVVSTDGLPRIGGRLGFELENSIRPNSGALISHVFVWGKCETYAALAKVTIPFGLMVPEASSNLSTAAYRVRLLSVQTRTDVQNARR